MKIRPATTWLLIAAACIFIVAISWRTQSRWTTRLPYRDRFNSRSAEEWMPFGGAWKVVDGTMVNRSDERGSKLITGSESWSDYQISADLQLRVHGGDVGLSVRVLDPEVGIDSYRGYYAGLRTEDDAVTIGRADHAWLETQPVPIPGGVKIDGWYRLHIVAVGCVVAVEATELATGQTIDSALKDRPGDCILHGRVGLRSTGTSGAWRNVEVKSATQSDLDAIVAHVPAPLGIPRFPMREDEYNRMRMALFPNVYPLRLDPLRLRDDSKSESHRADEIEEEFIRFPLDSIENVRAEPKPDTRVRLRGVVVFTAPVYLQDETGGIRLHIARADGINLGDEIEVLGKPVTEGPNLAIQVGRVRSLRDRTPVAPLSITPAQAASGAHEGSLVEITGTVASRNTRPDGSLDMQLTQQDQVFGATLDSDLFSPSLKEWKVGSTLRVLGICSMTSDVSSGRSFNLLVASASDVTVVSGPPWWSGWRLVRTIALALALIGICVYIFFRFERSKSAAILHERERLAHEMHDTLAQSFAGVGFCLQGVRKALHAEAQVPAPLLSEVDLACEMVAGTHREASASIAALHPNAQKEGDLLTQLERSTFSMVEGERLSIELVREGEQRKLSAVVTDALFRIGREAITNVLRHSQASSIVMQLRFRPKCVVLSITDDGRGFIVSPATNGFGFDTMRRRCQDIGATLNVESAPGEGTTISVESPYRRRRFLRNAIRRRLGLIA